nr:hypothetical protein [Tanacetum cinerariifolium]
MACQIIQKKQEEKRIEEEQVANALYWKIPACCDDDDDYNSAITPNEPVDSLSMEDEHLNTISATESNEFIKSSVENLVLNPSESKGENGCDVHACFTTFSNVLFDAEYEFDSSDDQSCSDEDVPEKIFSNPLFEEEIISMKIDQHHHNAESDLIESMLNHDSSIISSSLKIDSLLDEFVDQAANARYWKILAYYDDEDDYNFAITPNKIVDSLIMGDEHLDTISATESDEFIKSCVENLVPNPSESEGENGCDLPACFTTFSNILFDAEYEFDLVDNQSLHNEDFS